MGKVKRIEIYHLTPYEKIKLENVEEIIADGYNPLHVNLDSIGGSIRFSIQDIRNWQMKHKKDFLARLGVK